MADDTPVLSRSTSHGPLPGDELEVLGRVRGLVPAQGSARGPGQRPARGSAQGPAQGTEPDPTPDATVVLDGTTVRLGPAATAAVLDLLGRLATGAVVTVAEQDRWLNTSQAARLAGVSNTYLRQLADRGEIPVTYRGTHRRIHPDDVQAWVRSREEARVGPQEETAAGAPEESTAGARERHITH